ncbi:helix-turn-helix domain-containing protein [Teichococcus deserti]|uniref:helix-turn-helix domain-containing protein n=1 Tax=Teichococcus deserti TaxID=1817963 RepID=UPI000978A50C|nr:helix-turn-helix transcriptional regulator [Pseudoroseomonas deserti]
MQTRLKLIMDDRAVSAAHLARETGISPSTLNKLIHGHRKMAQHWAEKLAPVLEVSPEQFFRPISTENWEQIGHGVLTAPKTEIRESRKGASSVAISSDSSDIPIIRSTFVDSRIFVLEPSQTINKIRRPPALEFTKGVFGFFVVTDNMNGRFARGDLLLIDKDRPPARGGFSLIYTPQEDGSLVCELGFVGTDIHDQKRYVTDWSVPEVPRSGMALEDRPGTDAYKILTTAEILGL